MDTMSRRPKLTQCGLSANRRPCAETSSFRPGRILQGVGLTTVYAALVLALALFTPVDPAAAQAQPAVATLSLDRPAAAVGDLVVVSGIGWPAAGLVQVEICGNQGLNGSPDCAVAEGATVAVGAEGSWTTKLLVWTPPKPCPCIVRARSVDSNTSVSTGLTINGATQAPPALDGKAAAAVADSLLISDVHLEGGRSLSSWFGVAQRPVMVITITNTGVSDATSVAAQVSTTSSDQHIASVAVDSIAAGATRTIRIPIPVDTAAIGGYTVSGNVGGATFATHGSTYPWAIIVLVVVLLEFGVWRLSRWLRRRRHRAAEAPLPEADAPVGALAPAPIPTVVSAAATTVEAEPPVEVESQATDWAGVEAALGAAVQPAVARLLARGDRVTRPQIDREADAAVRPIVAAHGLDSGTAQALTQTLAEELAKLPVLHLSP